ncbi:hypothetical protein [Bradyrhizobium australafricanum]|uniref:hypothetical protein n=1 Tax=Bradyrhizobium australafricanum TaxID=2821406 RepID=UPI0024BF9766|nr:hypothetical protein [Bradyrhizobium australafricanum]MCA6104070.1 hypothetical protein [Bradyrhizobium australafricanum]
MRQKAGQLMAFDPSTPDREAQQAPQVHRCWQTVELSKAQRQGMLSGRTSMLELPANDLLAPRPGCSEKRHNQPCRQSRERKLGDQTKGDADKEPREERSCGCGRSQTLLYNEERPHGAIGNRPPILLQNLVGATSPPP